MAVRSSTDEKDAMTNKVKHTRSCDGRKVCSCMLRLESVYYQMNLAKRAVKARGEPRKKAKLSRNLSSYTPVRSLVNFDMDVKQYVASFLLPSDLAAFGQVNRQLRQDVEVLAEVSTKAFMSEKEKKHGKLVFAEEKKSSQTWTQYLDMHLNCVYRLFVQYGGYKTGPMREQFPQWAFGYVDIDPSDPSKTILPHAWKFQGHMPWKSIRTNGSGGEWQLRKNYKYGNAPESFNKEVKKWLWKIQPGSYISVAYVNEGDTDPAWWEAQVWYVWRAGGRADPATVFNSQENREFQMDPEKLGEHFMANPLDVIDVGKTPKSVCKLCAKKGRSFFECHLTRGHQLV